MLPILCRLDNVPVGVALLPPGTARGSSLDDSDASALGAPVG